MRRPDRRSSDSQPKPTVVPPAQPERPAGEQAASVELWERVQQAIRRLASVAR